MVVLLILVSIVVFILYIALLLILLCIGTVVLLYITSYYTCRGGNCGTNYDCGAFYVNDTVASGTNWRIGAALDCFILLYSSWWFF